MARKTYRQIVEETPMPPKVAALPKDKRGLPIPHIVMRDPQTGAPNFIVNDTGVVYRDCFGKGLCSVTGTPLALDDVWFIGGPGSAFHPAGCYNDPPVCREAVDYAMRVCPFLAVPSYAQMQEATKEKLMNTLVAHDPTMDPNKPEVFVVARATGCIIAHLGDDEVNHDGKTYAVPRIRIIPNRPFAEVEVWQNGEVLSHITDRDEIMRAMGQFAQSFLTEGNRFDDLPVEMAKAYFGQAEGFWPWKNQKLVFQNADGDLREVEQFTGSS